MTKSKSKSKVNLPAVTKEKEKELKNRKVNYPVMELKDRGILILPDHIFAQINYLHGHVGNVEWSGILFYDVVSGDVSKPKDFVLKAKDIFVMDIGTGGSTEYSPDEDIIDYYDAKGDEAMEYKTGHIHTHHTMNAFFSSTDMDELNDNVDKHNYYLSLIVNFNGKFAAKVAFLSDVHNTSKLNFVSDQGVLSHFKKSSIEKTMVVIDMSIRNDYGEEFFYNQFRNVLKKKEEKEKKVKTKWNTFPKGSLYGMSNEEFDKIPYSKIPGKASAIDADPKNMKTIEVERLARNVFSITPMLNEIRGIYQILLSLSKAPEDQLEIYYNMLADNIEVIIENFFDQSLEADEMVAILQELDGCLIRFKGAAALKGICDGISSVIGEFGIHYGKIKEEEDMEEQAENLKEELDNIMAE